MTLVGINKCSEHGYVLCEVGNECLYTDCVLFIVSPGATALSHRKPASAGISCDICGAKDTVKCTSYVTGRDEI